MPILWRGKRSYVNRLREYLWGAVVVGQQADSTYVARNLVCPKMSELWEILYHISSEEDKIF